MYGASFSFDLADVSACPFSPCTLRATCTRAPGSLEPNTDVVSGVCKYRWGFLRTPPWMSLPVIAATSKKRVLSRKALAIDSCDNHEKKPALSVMY